MQLRVLWAAALNIYTLMIERLTERLTDCATQHWLHSQNSQRTLPGTSKRQKSKGENQRRAAVIFDVIRKEGQATVAEEADLIFAEATAMVRLPACISACCMLVLPTQFWLRCIEAVGYHHSSQSLHSAFAVSSDSSPVCPSTELDGHSRC